MDKEYNEKNIAEIKGELQERERILKLIDKFDKEWSEGLHTDIVCVVLKELKKEVDKNG